MNRRLIAAPLLAALLLATACNAQPAPAAPDGSAAGAAFLAKNSKAKGVVTTPSGLQYRIDKRGPATGVSPGANDFVTFHYEGKLLTGEVFDSSYERGEPISGGASDFVPGFSEALTMMKPGDVWTVWIPPALGYGERAAGPIPANSVLQFKMELVSVGG